jgi:hypothetical protein
LGTAYYHTGSFAWANWLWRFDENRKKVMACSAGIGNNKGVEEAKKGGQARRRWRTVTHSRSADDNRGEGLAARYVARLELAGCAKILAVSPIWLPSLTSKRDECRVGKDEKRSFEGVIRIWTLHVLSSFEGC